LLEEQAALRRVATLVARGTDRLGVFAAIAEEVGRRGHEHLAGGRHDQRSSTGGGERACVVRGQ
jgi:hypothetical protein